MNYYTPDIERAPYEKMRSLQSERLAAIVRHAYESVPHYREKMTAAGLTPDDIRTVEDVAKLPFISKDDLREAYPYKLLAVPRNRVVRIQSTSGTTGKRVVAFYTQRDIDQWDECCARAIVAAGGTRDDVVHVCYGYGLFTGGPGLNGGSHMLGAMTLPMSSGNTDRQIQFMCDLGSTILCCTPSYAAFLAESLISKGLRDKICLKAGIFGAEAWSEEMRRDIEAKLGIKAYDIYGLTEITGPGVSFECSEQTGMHVNEDYFLPEIINPETGEPQPEGVEGELVFTTLTKEAFPILRYRTRDICVLSRKACSCGRTLIKMGKLMGRTDDMLIIRGVNVFPSQIETVLLQEGYSPNYLIVVDRLNHTDTFEVQVELTPEMFAAQDTVKLVAQREKNLVSAMRSMLGISPKVTLWAPRSIARSEGKAVRVIDKRKI